MKFKSLLILINFFLVIIVSILSGNYFLSFFAISFFLIGVKLYKNQILIIFHLVIGFILVRSLWIRWIPESYSYILSHKVNNDLIFETCLTLMIASFLYFLPFHSHRFYNKGKYSRSIQILSVWILLSIIQYQFFGIGQMGLDSVNYLKVIFPDFLILFLIFSINKTRYKALLVLVFVLITASYFSKAGLFKALISFLLIYSDYILNLPTKKIVINSTIVLGLLFFSYAAIAEIRLSAKSQNNIDLDLDYGVIAGQIAGRINIVDGYLGSQYLKKHEEKRIMETLTYNSKNSAGKLLGLYLNKIPLYKTHASSVGIFGFLNIINKKYFLLLVILFSFILKIIEQLIINLFKDHTFHYFVKFFIHLSLIYALIGGNLDRYFQLLFYSVIVLLVTHVIMRLKYNKV